MLFKSRRVAIRAIMLKQAGGAQLADFSVREDSQAWCTNSSPYPHELRVIIRHGVTRF
jgi:hypothetical protein